MQVPKLRFKEFNNEWKEKKLGELCEIVMEQSPDSQNYNNINNGIPLIQGNADICNRKSNPKNYTTQITKTCNIGDILMSVRAPVGKVAISNHYACIGRGICSIAPKFNYIYIYIYQFLIKYEKNWDKVSQGSTFTSINSKDIFNVLIPLPSLEEQEKIANFLSLIDKKIELQQKLVNHLNLYKKGLLQKVFSNNSEWKTVKLEYLTEYYTSNLTFQSIENIDNGMYPIYDASGICGYINTYQFDFKYICVIKDGAGVGRIQLCNKSSSVIGTLGVLKPINCNINYLYYAIQTINLKQDTVGTTIPHIYYKNYKNKLIPYPSLEEQNKIADLFTNLDKKIDFETKKLENLKTYKKGLLQKIFI